MASTMKKVHIITQIVRLKQVMKRWKNNSRVSAQPAGSNRRTPSGSFTVYVGSDRVRFVIPTRFLNLRVFISLLDKAEEEFGFQSRGALVLPCEVDFFNEILKLLNIDEHKFGKLSLDELVKVISDVGFEPLDQSCKEAASLGFVPLLQNTRV